MQGKKPFQEKLFNSFQLSERVPAENFYRRLKETLDLEFLRVRTRHLYGDTGNPSMDPVVFFKLMLVSYLENISSDRRLMDFCGMRLDILYFLGYDIDEELPWHSTVSRTRQLYDEDLFEELFSKVFSLCVESGMVSGHTQAMDSAYIKANASMSSVEVKRPVDELGEFLRRGRDENEEPRRKAKQDKADDEQKTLSSTDKELKELDTRNKYFLENKMKEHGSKVKDTFASYSNQTHYSPTDPDARIATKPGKPRQFNYLCSMAVDSSQGVISHVQADFADKKDSRYLVDITTKTERELRRNHLTMDKALADTGYSSGKNYHDMEELGITPFIPTSGVYKHDREGFTYDKERDLFVCPRGKLLKYKKTLTTSKGRMLKHYRSTRMDCRGCPLKISCVGDKTQEKKLEVSYYQEEYERAWQRQQTTFFKRMMRLRQGTVEPVFGNLINYYGLRKINTLGIKSAHKSMLMSAIAFNLKKLMKHLKNKTTPQLQVLGRELCVFQKADFANFINSLMATPDFVRPVLICR